VTAEIALGQKVCKDRMNQTAGRPHELTTSYKSSKSDMDRKTERGVFGRSNPEENEIGGSTC